MKTKNDPRHLRRINLIKALYSQQFAALQKPLLNRPEMLIYKEIINAHTQIDQKINQYALKFTTEKMARIDLAILQLGVYELTVNNQTPYSVIVDECIELAKEFGAAKSANFINGVLGKLVEDLKNDQNAN